jgi:hypothetical protein
MARGRRRLTALLALLLLGTLAGPRIGASAPPFRRNPSLFRELRWRSIGPFRGGRTKAATGVRGGRASSTSAS